MTPKPRLSLVQPIPAPAPQFVTVTPAERAAYGELEAAMSRVRTVFTGGFTTQAKRDQAGVDAFEVSAAAMRLWRCMK